MIDKIALNAGQPLFDPDVSKQQDARTSAQINIDASLHLDNVSLLDSAMQSEQADPDIVAKAKEALLSGKLDSYAHILQAAEDIIKFGV